MAKQRNRGSQQVPPEQRLSSNPMHNGNQPAEELIEAEDERAISALTGSQHQPDEDGLMDNTRDAPRTSTGPVTGQSTAEKIGGVTPSPGAQLDPATERVPAPWIVIAGFVIVVIAIAVLVAVL